MELHKKARTLQNIQTLKMQENLYDILGVSRQAKKEQIRQAYRKLARKYHPDVNPGDHAAEEKFKQVASAHEVLANEDKRRAYDEFGDDSLKGGFDPEKARDYQRWTKARSRGADAVNRKRGTAGEAGFVDFGDIFGWTGGASIPRRGADVRANVSMDLRQAIEGAEVSIGIPNAKPSTVRIPAGADNGSTIRIPKRGSPGLAGGPSGDLVITIRVTPHPRLTRRGLNLHLEVPVTLDEAYNGGKISVPTLEGPLLVTVPPLSQPGSKLRLRGKGVRRKKKQGDLIVALKVQLPDKHDAKLSDAIRDASSSYETPVKREVQL